MLQALVIVLEPTTRQSFPNDVRGNLMHLFTLRLCRSLTHSCLSLSIQLSADRHDSEFCHCCHYRTPRFRHPRAAAQRPVQQSKTNDDRALPGTLRHWTATPVCTGWLLEETVTRRSNQARQMPRDPSAGSLHGQLPAAKSGLQVRAG